MSNDSKKWYEKHKSYLHAVACLFITIIIFGPIFLLSLHGSVKETMDMLQKFLPESAQLDILGVSLFFILAILFFILTILLGILIFGVIALPLVGIDETLTLFFRNFALIFFGMALTSAVIACALIWKINVITAVISKGG
ncbi:MAG: hypothetical protein ACTSW4_06145 [Candidatus Ranarchaeia archaeon]